MASKTFKTLLPAEGWFSCTIPARSIKKVTVTYKKQLLSSAIPVISCESTTKDEAGILRWSMIDHDVNGFSLAIYNRSETNRTPIYSYVVHDVAAYKMDANIAIEDLNNSYTLEATPIVAGGTGASTWAGALNNLGVEWGHVEIQVAADGVSEQQVTFSKTYSAAPHVMVSLYSGSTNKLMGNIQLSTASLTKTGFKIKAYNTNASNSFTPTVQWLAIGN